MGVPYWNAFQVLNRGRVWSMGMGGAVPMGIGYHDLSAYARDYGLPIDELVELVGQMDGVFLAHAAERQKQTSPVPTVT